jgi:hypothetical protein
MSIMNPPAVDNTRRIQTPLNDAASALQDRLRVTRSRLIYQRWAVGICLILSAAAVGLAESATADYFLELSRAWRAAFLICLGIVSATSAFLVWRRWIAPYTLHDAAADAESRLSEFGQRLRTTLDYDQQLPRPAAASPSLLSALHQQTFHVSEQAEWDDAIDRRPLWKSVFLGFVITGIWVFALLAVPEFRTATARALTLPFEYTTVTFSPQSETVRLGESVVITANVSGRPVDAAQIQYRPAGSQDEWQALDLLPTEPVPEKTTKDSKSVKQAAHLRGELIAKLSDLQQDLEFVVVAGPRDLPLGSIRVLQPLKLEKTQAHIRPPEYTGRKEETVEAVNLKVLEGSNVELSFQLNRAASQASLVRLENGSANEDATAQTAAAISKEVSLKLEDNHVFGTLSDLRSNVSLMLSAEAVDGIRLEPVKISIRVQLDLKPQVQFVQPAEELVVTPTTEVPFIVDAMDDLGLHKVGVMYQIGCGPLRILAEQQAGGSSEPFQLESLMMLEDQKVKYPDSVTYYAFAEDNYFGQPRRTTTPLRFIDIRPFKMAFQVVDSQCPPCNGSSVTLEELITRQRQNLTQIFAEQNETKPTKTISERLATNQKELLEATNEFASGLAVLGQAVPTLEVASKQMEQAIAAIETPNLPDAVTAEQEALSALIHARENLRKMLKQSSSQSASACRKFDRQQRQKLRMPEKKPDDQQQQLANARSKLEDLAKRERKWSEEAKQSCPNSGSKPGQPSQQSASPSVSKQAQSPPQSEQSQNGQNPASKSPVPSPAEVAAAQEKLKAELSELQKEIDKLSQNSSAAGQQSQQIAESMQRGLDEVKKQNGEAAAEAGEKSAEQLERLADHLSAMNARDFGQRLDQAQNLAQQLASRQEQVARQLGQGQKSKGESRQAASLQAEGSSGDKSSDSAGTQPGQQQSKGNDGKQANADQDFPKSGSSEKASTDGQQPGGGKSTEQLARDERALATETEMLAELLDRLKGDSALENGGVRAKLDRVQAENPPRDIAAEMRQAANDLMAARPVQAGQGAALARDRLDELSRSLGAARGEYAQPQLKELMELEEQLAQLQKQLQRSKGQTGAERGTAGQKWEQLEPRLNRMAEGDRRLADALQQMREGSKGKGSQAKATGSQQAGTASPKPGSPLKAAPNVEGGQQMPEGFYPGIELGDYQGMKHVSKALQAKIQEAILAAALLDADQPVPPAYKELVEKYYRTLSDDLK